MISRTNPLVTIGIPTYNRADGNLRKVIERALGQTYKNVEVIVSDNCSSDKTPELVRSFEDPRLRYIRQETNIGPNNNFNYCMNQARGEYFLLFHDDDMIDDDFIEACISSLKPDQTVGAIFTGVRIIDEYDNARSEHKIALIGSSPADFVHGWYKGKIALYLCNTLYNTARLREAGGFSSRKNLFDDLVPTLSLVTKYGSAHVGDIKASFRRHTGNRGSKIPINDWVDDSLYLLDVLDRLLPDEGKSLRKEGELFFCKQMYQYIFNRMAVSRGIIDYLRIYKAFNYCYSPLHYFYIRKLGWRINRIIQLFIGKK